MKKYMAIFFLFLAGNFCSKLNAQELVPFESESAKWGLKNSQGKIIREPKYDYIAQSPEGFFRLNTGGVLYPYSSPPLIGMMYCAENMEFMGGSWSLADSSGKEITSREYGYIGNFSTGLARVTNEFEYVDPDGDKYSGGKWGFIDLSGKEFIALNYDFVESFSGGKAIVVREGKWGMIDSSGKEIIAPAYDYLLRFSDHLFRVSVGGKFDGTNLYWGGKWGLVDARTGKEVVSPTYDWIGNLVAGKSEVTLGEKSYLIDENGEELKTGDEK